MQTSDDNFSSLATYATEILRTQSQSEDIELTYFSLQELKNPQKVVEFFAHMGYNTSERASLTLEELNITFSRLQRQLFGRLIERIVYQDNGTLEIYLLEPRNLTKELGQVLVQCFPYKDNHNYLFILASKHRGIYRRLNFVLVERGIPVHIVGEKVFWEPTLLYHTFPKAYARSFWIDLRKPDKTALSLLRRFTYTESSAELQYEKLLHAYFKEQWDADDLKQSISYFTNQGLFSNYYLRHRLREHQEWTDTKIENQYLKAYKKFITLYKSIEDTEYAGQTIDAIFSDLLEPAMNILGFSTQLTNKDSFRYYILYTAAEKVIGTFTTSSQLLSFYDGSAERSKKTRMDTFFSFDDQVDPSQARKPLAYCIVYPWNYKFSGIGDQNDPQVFEKHPGAAATSLLDSGEIDWVIVTNGRYWRLYTAKAASRISNYYEVDLLEIIALKPKERWEAFHYFWWFFRAASFIPPDSHIPNGGEIGRAVGEKQHQTFLDDVLEEGEKHALALGATLKARVFQEIFPYFAEGFIVHAQTHYSLPPDLEKFPIEEQQRNLEPFFSGTLTFLYRLLVLSYAEARGLLPVQYKTDYRIHSLELMKRRIANIAGWDEKYVFHQLMQTYSYSETYLYDKLQALFCAMDKGNADLGVPIYNGGLFMTNPSSDDPSPEAETARFLSTHKIPDIYLAIGLDRMARDLMQPSPSPENVAQQPEPILVSIDYKDLGVTQLGSIYEGLQEYKLCIASSKKGNKVKVKRNIPLSKVELKNDRSGRKLLGSYYTLDSVVKYIVEQALEPVLSRHISILNQYQSEMRETLNEQRKYAAITGKDPYDETYIEYKKVIEAFFDLRVLDPAAGSGHFLVAALNYLTDRIYQMLQDSDWHPITYELDCARRRIQELLRNQGFDYAADRLDNYTLLKRRILKSCIYGIDINPMAVELTKVSLWLHTFASGLPLAFLDHHIKRGDFLSSTLQEKIISNQELAAQLPADTNTATHLIRSISECLDGTIDEVITSRDNYHKAQEILTPYKVVLNAWLLNSYFSNKKHKRISFEGANFFYVNTEFPELYDEYRALQDGKGFDAVVSNPPWGAKLNSETLAYLRSNYPSHSDSYALFTAFALSHLKEGGYLGYITPDTILRKKSLESLRQRLLTQTEITEIIETGPLFSEARDTWCLILLLSKRIPTISHQIKHKQIKRALVSPEERLQYFDQHMWSRNTKVPQKVWQVRPDHVIGYLTLQSEREVIDSIEKASIQLRNISSGMSFKISRGEEQGKLKLETSAEGRFRMVLTDHIERYWVVEGIPINEEILSPTKVRNYYTHPKIWVIRIQKQRWQQRIVAAFDERANSAALKTLQIIVSEQDDQQSLLYLSALLSSTLMNFWCTNSLIDDLNQSYLEKLPIRPISFTTPHQVRSAIFREMQQQYQVCLTENDIRPILSLVAQALSHHLEQSDAIYDLLAFLAREMLRLNKDLGILGSEPFTKLNKIEIDSDLSPKRREKGRSLKKGDQPHYIQGRLFDESVEAVHNNSMPLILSRHKGEQANWSNRQKHSFHEKQLLYYLQAINEIIDEIIYKLYGLNQREIDLIKEHEKRQS